MAMLLDNVPVSLGQNWWVHMTDEMKDRHRTNENWCPGHVAHIGEHDFTVRLSPPKHSVRNNLAPTRVSHQASNLSNQSKTSIQVSNNLTPPRLSHQASRTSNESMTSIQVSNNLTPPQVSHQASNLSNQSMASIQVSNDLTPPRLSHQASRTSNE